MAASYILLSNLRAGRCSNTAEVRLLRFWEARNIKKDGELMSIDMLLLDEQSTLIQGTVSASRVGTYRERFVAGSVYSLSGFDVTRSDNKFRLSDAPVSIRFTDGTTFEELQECDKSIPNELFRFRSYDQVLALANTNRQLPDILGELTAIRSTINDGTQGSQRVMLTLRIESNVNVCVSLFDGLAFAFADKMKSYGGEPKVVLITSINPKVVGGRLFLNGTSGTHMFFDTETDASKTLYTRLFADGVSQASSSSKLIHAQKIEPLTVSELNQFVLSADPQVIEFLCTAKVTGIQTEKGWCYIGCATCAKKLVKEVSSFTCLFCDKNNAVASLRYRVELSVSDSTGDAVFVAFDMDMSKLTNVPASEAAQVIGIGENARVEGEIPQFITDIVGKTFTFQIKLGEFNFTSKHQTFTISRIFTVAQNAPLPDFVGDGVQHGPNGGLQVQNPISSLVPISNIGSVGELSVDVAAELGATTGNNLQPSSSVAPEEVPSATSTTPVEAEEVKKKKPRLA